MYQTSMYTILNKQLLQGKWELFTILKMDLFPNTKALTNSEQIPQRSNTSQLFGYKHLELNLILPWSCGKLSSLPNMSPLGKNSSQQNSIYVSILLCLRIELPPQ